MFTGIVEAQGTIAGIERLDRAIRITIAAPSLLVDASHGDSISVEGVCLTIAEMDDTTFAADVMQETLDRSNLGARSVGDAVNLERAMPANGRFGGHVVQGHVDATTTLVSRTSSEHWDVLRFRLPADIKRYLVEKGSITVNGTSLTVSALSTETSAHDEGWFEVSLIPTTLKETTLGALEEGETVNLEVDVLAKYIERMLRFDPQGSQPRSEG